MSQKNNLSSFILIGEIMFILGLIISPGGDEIFQASLSARVSCKTNSMNIPCGVIADYAKISDKDKLIPGMIYIYKQNTTEVIHRLVACADENCNLAIFKGDTNLVGENVNRTDILYYVESLNFPK